MGTYLFQVPLKLCSETESELKPKNSKRDLLKSAEDFSL